MIAVAVPRHRRVERRTCKTVVLMVLDHFEIIDVLVNNIEYGQFTFFEETVKEQIREVFETNLFGLMLMTRAVHPMMR